MKNFTNNFKQFTSRLSARWLIMALMLLVGTSSAWAVDYYITGDVIGNWTEGANFRLKMTAHETNIVKAVVYLTGDFKVVNGATGWTENYNQPAPGTGTTLTGGKNSNFNLQLNSGYSAPITIYYNYSTNYVWATATACTSCCGSDIFRVAGSSNLCGSNWNGNDDNNKMECSDDIFSKSYNITGNTSYTFKIVKNNSDWINTINSNASITNKIALKTTGGDNNVTLSENPSSDGKLTIYYDPNKGIYATFEKYCNTPTAGNFTYTAPANLVYDGSEKAATVSWNGTQGGSITVKYSSSSTEFNEATPTNVGTYYVFVSTTEGNGICEVENLYINKSFEITKANQNNDFKITNEQTTYCGFPASDIALTANGGSTTETVTYTSGNTNVATIVNSKLHAVGEGTVTITATRPGGTNYNDITATKSFTFYKAPDAPTVSVTNLIKCGDNTSEGLITLKNYNEDYSYSISPDDEVGGDAQNGYQISIADNYTITVTRTVNETCSLSTPSATIPVVLTDNTPVATVSIADVAPICAGGSATLTCNVTPTKGTVNSYTWTLPNGNTQVTNTNTLSTGAIEQAGTYTYSVVVTLENEGCPKDFPAGSKSVTVKAAPEAPDFGVNNSETVCQNTTVTLPTEYKGVQLKWYEDQNRTSSITSFTAGATSKTVYAASFNETCESAELAAYTYNIYPVPTISVSASPTEATCHQMVTLTANTGNTVEGALVEWYEGETLVGTGNTYTFTKETASPATTITAKVRNYTTCDYVTADAKVSFIAHEVCSTNSYVQGKIVYLQPNDKWKEAGARFAAYFFSGGTETWVNMTNEDGDDVYACEVPEGRSKVIFCRMNPSGGNNWDSKWAQTEDLVLSKLVNKKFVINDSNPGGGSGYDDDLDPGKTLKTIALTTTSENWNKDGATFWAHAWSTADQTMGFVRMIPTTTSGVYLVDIRTNYTNILFERRDASGNQMDGGADKHKTADLVLDTYGNNFVITKAYQQDYPDAKADGEWRWKWYEDSYTLGLSTKASVTDGSTTINATGAFYKTDCAPGLEFGFKYIKSENEPTESDWASANAKYVDNRPIAVGEEFNMNIDAAGGGIYWVRSYGRYNNNETYYGNVVRVIVQGCTAGYEFEVANTSAVVQACGESRVLPAIEFLSNTEVAGETFTYQWKNEDDSDATNLSATNIATPTFNGKSSQNYKVIVAKMVGGQLKCSKTATYQVAYDDNSPKAIINDGAETITAEINEQLVLQGAAHYTESFTWTVKENDVDVTSTMLSDASILNPTFNTKEAGTYVVTLTAAGNQICEAHTATATVKVNAPTEDCASGDIEVKLITSTDCFNTSGGADLYISQDGTEWTYVTKISGGDSHIILSGDLTEKGITLPAKIMFGALTEFNCDNKGNARAYTITDITNDDKGKFITYTLGSTYDNTTSVIANGTTYKNKFTIASNTKQAISNTVSAPTISSPKAVVNDDTKKATLSAYLAKTGCSAITNYGFQYIMSETEPSESGWTNSTKQDFTNNIVIGKTFKWETTELGEGKYWFRAYAKNEAGKISYTSPISFEIIADGPYPVFIDAVQDHESEAALYITNDGYVEVKIYNKGKDDDDDVLEGSYKLIIENQNQNLLFTPLIKNTPIEHQSSVTFTSKDKVANLDHYNITATLTYKGRKDTRNISKCTPIKAAQDLDNNGLRDTIYYTIDAAAVTDKCMLVFPTVYEAVEHLKKSSEAEEDYQYTEKIGNGYILQQPVVMQVAYSTNRYKGNISVNTTGGGDKVSATIIPIININNDDDNGNCQGGAKYNVDNGNSDDVKYYSLTIRALNPNARPALQHLAIRDSRYITLDNLNLVASSTIKDNALDIDCNNNSWVGNVRGKFKNTYVTVKNCNITSKGFTCVHVSAVDQVHFLNNEITAELDNDDVDDDNVRCWGASVKFIRSENLSFIRNNFMGTHATSIWLQEVKGALFMNNVLWNNNKIEKDIFAMFRIVHQTGDYHPKNIGIYYNTLFLDENSTNRSNHPKFNFLTLNSNDQASNDDPIDHNGTFDTGTIEFMYNNCYSYDTKTAGRPDVPFKYDSNGQPRTAWAGLCHNNFWSVYDDQKSNEVSVFAFDGCDDVKYINVKENVCKTTAANPNSLVISGSGLDEGIKPSNLENSLSHKLGADLIFSDRTRSDVRPNDDKPWTLGAYQKTDAIATDSIIWQGAVSTDWDDRNNWIDAKTKNTLTCVNTLATDLKVIIPAPHSENYPAPSEDGIVNYPIIPEFNRNAEINDKYGVEIVNAGQGLGGDVTLYADSIGLEYGASLRGVENLKDHYNESGNNFTAGRDQWTLVGTVVKPWTDGTKQSTRNIKSGDYFIEKQTPHVYMHYAYMDGNTAKWSEPFTSKEESLEVTDVMAINLPNQYGEYKLTSQDYYTYSPDADPEKLNDNVVPKNYEFVGKFVNEASLPYITGLSTTDPVLLNNSYPCNIDPKELEEEGQGTVWMYDYKGGSFSLTSEDDVLIKPQHGFIFKSTGGTYQVTKEMLVSGDTKSRSAEAEMPIFSLNLFNANSTEGEYSRVIVKYDELGDNGPVDLDLEKMFAENASTPELYIVMYDGKYQRVHVNSKEIVIPLGIRLMTSMNVSFQKFKAEGFDKVTLVDEVANKEYDLLSGKEVVTEKLLAGDIEGRFFLNLKEKEEDDDIEGDDNVSTEIEEDSAEQSINILVEGENTVKVITNGVQLENIYVSDMTGRTVGYKTSGYSAVVELPVAQGVYMINVIGDTASRTEKVILK